MTTPEEEIQTSTAVEVVQPDSDSNILRPNAPVPNVVVVATDQTAMAVAQARLTDWCSLKIQECRTALQEYEENLALAKKNRWRTGGLTTAVRREKQRITFYEKVEVALRAGYCIIPNFQADVFAIRREKAASGMGESTSWDQAFRNMPGQAAESLPVGEGENVSPTPTGRFDHRYERDRTNYEGKVTGKEEMVVARANGFAEIEFPFALAKTEILTEAQRAMALKVFDEMGALPASRRTRNGDPMVVGRIRKPWMKPWQANNHVTFLVVWFLDTVAL